MGVPGDVPALIPELQVSDLSRSLAFYQDAGFTIAYRRAEEGFVMLHHGRAALMLETIGGPGRRLGSRDLDHPLGRGINFQIQVDDVTSVYARLQRGNWSIELPLEQRWYRVGDHDAGNEQFVAADPDGYLFRFFRDLGVRCPDSDSGSL